MKTLFGTGLRGAARLVIRGPLLLAVVLGLAGADAARAATFYFSGYVQFVFDGASRANSSTAPARRGPRPMSPSSRWACSPAKATKIS